MGGNRAEPKREGRSEDPKRIRRNQPPRSFALWARKMRIFFEVRAKKQSLGRRMDSAKKIFRRKKERLCAGKERELERLEENGRVEPLFLCRDVP